MSDTNKSEKPSDKLEAIKAIIAKRKQRKQAILDDIYEELGEIETAENRHIRIMNDPSAWNK